jgi:membrane associated rhomboid family serine protease
LYRTISPGIKWLVIACAGTYVLQLLIGTGMILFFGLVPQFLFRRFMVWQLATYLFLHGGIFHLLFNMFVLWMFGTEIERYWGTRNFLYYYFFTGIVAGFVTALVSYSVNMPIIGASGAIFGVLAAFGLLFPERIILIFFLFPMRAKHAVLLFAGIELLVLLSAGVHGLGSLAHLSGMAAGYLYLKHGDVLKNIWQAQRERQHRKSFAKTREREYRKKQFIQDIVDPILDKISREGMDSLTEEEKKILKKAREFDGK